VSSVPEIGLPAYTRCPCLRDPLDAKGPGCSIYDRRPASCSYWRCLWLKSAELPEAARPDRVGWIVNEVVDLIQINGEDRPAAQIHALPGHEDDWRQEKGPTPAAINLLLNQTGAVMWHMANGLAIIIATMSDGSVIVSSPAPPTPGYEPSVGKRLLRAAELKNPGPTPRKPAAPRPHKPWDDPSSRAH
jgi:hypothetical protein